MRYLKDNKSHDINRSYLRPKTLGKLSPKTVLFSKGIFLYFTC